MYFDHITKLIKYLLFTETVDHFIINFKFKFVYTNFLKAFINTTDIFFIINY